MKKTDPIFVTIVNLETGTRTDYSSVSGAAHAIGVSFQTIKKMMLKARPHLKWYAYRMGCEAMHEENIATYSRMYADRFMESKVGKAIPSRGAGSMRVSDPSLKPVSLRIDAHTYIMVPPHKATEECAEKYRQRLKKARK